MILSDRQIRDRNIVQPFVPSKVRNGVVSYGLGHFGYDFRFADEWRTIDEDYVLRYVREYGKLPVLDVKNLNERLFKDTKAEYIDVPPHGFVLGRTVEHWTIPNDVTAVALGKSTYARVGLILNTTPFEAGWSGTVTLEISNTTSLPVRVYAFEGAGQALFFRGDEPCEVSYTGGKYDNQPATIVNARVE